MAKEKTRATARADAASRQSAVEKRHRVVKKVSKPNHRDRYPKTGGPRVDLPARLQLNKPSFKSYFEFQENKDKKDKKLETSVTKDKNPPPGFSFVPVGNPELSKKCKELSREAGYLIFIVSDTTEERKSLHDHVHRVGYHFRSTVVEDASNELGGIDAAMGGKQSFTLEDNDKIPETQMEINKQADAALRDLFPRIPNHDREQIIAHAFQKGAIGNSRQGAPVVGLSKELPLARRVQLAANAHIRHVHTRYDELLRETDWFNARRLVEPVCLDIIMKWRGDEETGRDQLDEILREVVIIPDSDDEEEEEEKEVESASTSDDEVQFVREVTRAPSRQPSPPRARTQQTHMPLAYRPPAASRLHMDDPGYDEQQRKLRQENKRQNRKERQMAKRRQKQQRPDKQERRGFARWQAYDEARKRNQAGHAASAGLNYDDENTFRQDIAPQPYYPPQSMDRQPLQDAHNGRLNDSRNHQPQFGRQDVGSPIPHPLDGLSEKDRLLDIPQEMFARRPQEPPLFQHQMQRPDSTGPLYMPRHETNASSQHGLPILTYEQHQQRAQQYQQNQSIPQRPRSPDDRHVLASIENIDLTDSPVPVRRSSPRLANTASRPVMAAPQPVFENEYRHLNREPAQFRLLPERSEIVYVHDHDGKRRRVIQEPRHQYAEPGVEYIAIVPRPRQDTYTFPSSRVQVPVSQPDMRWIDEPYDPRQPILLSSSPLTENATATAAQPRVVPGGGDKHSGQPSGMFEDIFYDSPENQAQAQRGESKRPRPVSGYGHEQFVDEPAMRRVDPRAPSFGVPSVPMPSTMQYPLQEDKRPEPNPFSNGEQSQPRLVERLPVFNQHGERIHVPDTQLQRMLQEADARGPVYVRGSIHEPRQQERQEIQQSHMEQLEYDDRSSSQYVSEARPRHDYRSLRPTAPLGTQSDIDGQPRYRESRTHLPHNPPPPLREIQHERRPIHSGAPTEHIGADGQRYITLPGIDGQPSEVLPVRTEPRPISRPQSMMYREGARGPERTQGGFERYEGYGGQQRGYGRGDVIVLDD